MLQHLLLVARTNSGKAEVRAASGEFRRAGKALANTYRKIGAFINRLNYRRGRAIPPATRNALLVNVAAPLAVDTKSLLGSLR